VVTLGFIGYFVMHKMVQIDYFNFFIYF